MFRDFALHERVLNALQAKGFEEPTPIQSGTLPHALEGRDVLGQARTGTGKTLAFSLPIASGLEPSSERGRAPRALVLAPTRELALQVAGELSWAAAHLEVITVYGGTGYERQANQLRRGVDVVVATPGRALDYLKQDILQLGEVRFVVLDEADEMLSMGFEEEVEALLAATPPERQTMLFSATLPGWARRMADQHLRDPVRVNVIKEEEITYREIAMEVNQSARTGVLSDVLHAHAGARAIVFTHTKAEVDALAQSLTQAGHPAEAVHGDLNQVQRERVVGRFRSGQVRVLVGTNVAARGLDIPEVDLVVHYRLPTESDAYQHRSGRTGRAGREGTVVILYGPRERRSLESLERAVNRRFERGAPPPPEEVQGAKLTGLMQSIGNLEGADLDVWRDAAERIVKAGEVDTVAGMLALALGGAPAQRSLLTGEEGWVTLELVGRQISVPQAVRILKNEGAGDLGRIQLSSAGALVDVRPEGAPKLIGSEFEGLAVRRATSVPEGRPQGGGGRRFDGQRRGGGSRHRGRGEGSYRR